MVNWSQPICDWLIMAFNPSRVTSAPPTAASLRSSAHSFQDQSFTDLAHKNLAPAFYGQIFPGARVEQASVEDDQKKGIDYHVLTDLANLDGSGSKRVRFNVQERFLRIDHPMLRTSKEFTLRYSRPDSLSPDQKQSEFFKIKAHYLYYGITNATKATATSAEVPPTACLRQVLVDLPKLMKLVDDGKIAIGPPNSHPCVDPQTGVPHTGLRENREKGAPHNSWLVIFNVEHLVQCGLARLDDRKESLFPAHQGYLPQDNMCPAPRVISKRPVISEQDLPRITVRSRRVSP